VAGGRSEGRQGSLHTREAPVFKPVSVVLKPVLAQRRNQNRPVWLANSGKNTPNKPKNQPSKPAIELPLTLMVLKSHFLPALFSGIRHPCLAAGGFGRWGNLQEQVASAKAKEDWGLFELGALPPEHPWLADPVSFDWQSADPAVWGGCGAREAAARRAAGQFRGNGGGKPAAAFVRRRLDWGWGFGYISLIGELRKCNERLPEYHEGAGG
jgi:hypothetical protein